MSAEDTKREMTPDRRPLTELQAKRLAQLARVDAKDLVGQSTVELAKTLRWRFDFELFGFRQVCGRVVRRDPSTGALEGVPGATVHVEDTDCHFLGYFPPGYPWIWFFPFHCHREVIATATTDHCGRFCVWVPRWEIDWMVRWRRARLCFPELFRPRIRDFIEELELLPEPPEIRKIPLPDPPLDRLGPGAFEKIAEGLGPVVAERLQYLQDQRGIGEASEELDVLLDSAVPVRMPPPLPAKLRAQRATDLAHSNVLADEIPLSKDNLQKLRFDRFIGPFRRCVDIYVGLWMPFFDVPDVTFRVTQDVDSDGNEETIYSEGFFDVRWNAGAIPDVVLEASQDALSTPACDGPEIDPEDCSEPTIITAGLMPLEGTHFDKTTGYALKINRPRSGGLSTGALLNPGEAPFWRTVQLHGCQRFPGAVYYRLLYAYESNAELPFQGLKWYAPQYPSGPPFLIVPDPNGWYDIKAAGDLVFPHWLLNWPTHGFANGKYTVRLQTGDASRNVLGTSNPVCFEVDNSKPSHAFDSLKWRAPGVPGYNAWRTLPTVCPIIRRPAGATIELEVRYQAWADHFRNVFLIGYGCGAGAFAKLPPPSDFDHWHTNPATDNHVSETAVFRLPGTAAEGAYTVGLNIYGRAFNPAGGDNGPATNWEYNPAYSWSHPRRHIAVIDA